MRVAVCVCCARPPSPYAHALPGMIPFKSVNPPNKSCGYGNNVWTSEASTARGAARTDENHRQ